MLVVVATVSIWSEETATRCFAIVLQLQMLTNSYLFSICSMIKVILNIILTGKKLYRCVIFSGQKLNYVDLF